MIAAVAVAGLILGGRAVHLTVADGLHYPAFAAEQGTEHVGNTARGRGDVLSADGRKLATSLKTERVVSTPYQIENPGETARSLSGILNQDAAGIEEKLTARDAGGNLKGYSVVGAVEPGAAEEVMDLGLEGITVSPAARRVYPDGPLASHVTGHLGDYGEPFGGIESRYDEELESGHDVTVTIDAAVQQELESALDDMLEEHGAENALGLVMRVEDGAVVALANAPGYDNNKFGQTASGLQRNRVLTDPYEPGSTFKPFTLAAAFEEGAVGRDTTFVVPDHMQVADRVIHDSEPHETWVLNPRGVLEKSSNVGTIQVAQTLGGDKLEEYIRRFGFGEATGVDLWGEDPGVVPAYEDWSGSSIGNIPIGQGLTVTPLQLAAGYATIANGGRKVTPHVLRSHPPEKAPEEAPEEAGPRVISGETSTIVRGMLQSVVENGSGHLAQIPGYNVAGKTGTSEKVDPATGTYGAGHIASFIGFAPASDPEYVTLIVADEPKTEYWGEVVAAPAFEKVMSFTLGYFNVPPDREPTAEEASG